MGAAAGSGEAGVEGGPMAPGAPAPIVGLGSGPWSGRGAIPSGAAAPPPPP